MKPGVMYPLLAEKVSYDPKQTAFVIFHLNPKAKFSDGSPVTADDVKFSFDAFRPSLIQVCKCIYPI